MGTCNQTNPARSTVEGMDLSWTRATRDFVALVFHPFERVSGLMQTAVALAAFLGIAIGPPNLSTQGRWLLVAGLLVVLILVAGVKLQNEVNRANAGADAFADWYRAGLQLRTRPVGSEAELVAWREDVVAWTRSTREAIAAQFSDAEALIFADTSGMSAAVAAGSFNSEHSDVLVTLDFRLKNLRTIMERRSG